MTTVYKYPLPIGDVVQVWMPQGAYVLYVATQGPHESPYIWARVNTLSPMISHKFRFAGTGHPIDDNVGRHVGSFMMQQGALVFHVFEVMKGAS